MKRVFYMFSVLFLLAWMAYVAEFYVIFQSSNTTGVLQDSIIVSGTEQEQETIKETERAEGAAVTAAPNVLLPEKDAVRNPEAVADREMISEATAESKPQMLPEYEKLYAENNDMIGWLSIADTNIDYAVMQTPEDEEYYIYRDFYGKEDKNGSLFMDTDCIVGVGTKEQQYCGGDVPTTNLMIYGHTMKSGKMFGNLDLYTDEVYGKAHNIICFDSLYEKREYELIAVFYSEIYYKSQKVFKYYKFFQADTQEEFDDWYDNIKQLSIYDTGVTAEFGDEFITLSCCAYHVEDGRFVVIGKRIK